MTKSFVSLLHTRSQAFAARITSSPQRSRAFTLFCSALIVVALHLGAPAPAYAQAQSSATLTDRIGSMGERAKTLLPMLTEEVLKPIGQWGGTFALSIAVLLMIISFLRVWRESNGGGDGHGLAFLLLRYLFFLFMIGNSIALFMLMAAAGRELAEGDTLAGSGTTSVIHEFYLVQRGSFDESYSKMALGTFTVPVDGKDFTVKPSAPGMGTILGVLTDVQGSVKDIESRLNDSGWLLTKLYAWFHAARTLLEGADTLLIFIGGGLTLICKIAAPIMVAVGIDQKLAHKVTYPYAWGVLVLTIIWPSLSYFLRGMAYLGGNVAMALGDSKPVYNWSSATLREIRSAADSPVDTVLLAAIMMTAFTFLLAISTYLAYRFSMGQIYEGVASTMTQFAAMAVGTAVEAYSSTLGAAINQQAANTTAHGSFDATTSEARHNRDAGYLRNKAGYEVGKAGALSAAQMQIGMATAGKNTTISQVYTTFGSLQQSLPGYNERLANAGRDREISANENQRDKNVVGARLTNSEGQVGRDAAAQNILTERDQAYVSQAPLVGQLGGGSLATRQAGQEKTATNMELSARMSGLTEGRVRAEDNYLNRGKEIAGRYAGDNQQINRETGDKLAIVAERQAAETIGAARSAAGTAIRGHERGRALNDQATQTEFAGKTGAAQINLDAAKQAAQLQAISSVISRVGSKIAADIEKGMEIRF